MLVGTKPPNQPSPDAAPPPASLDRQPWLKAQTVGDSSEGVPESPPPYLAAGVLPFCILGGDLLFLLGQQLRFRSRARGASTSFPKARASTPAAAGGANSKGQGSGPGGAHVKSPCKVIPPVRRPRRSPRPKLSMPSTSLAAANPSLHTPASETIDAGGSVEQASASQMPTLFKNRVGGARLDSERVGGSVGAAGTAAVAQLSENAANPQADEADPSALPNKGCRSRGTISCAVDSRHSDPNNVATDGSPAAATAAVAAATTAGESRSSQSSEAPVDTPGQDAVPAGLLWSDFGGGREAGEDAEETASREFAEESFGIFHGVRLESDSVARSQATMSSALRDPSLRGKRVFESRNGGYVMFIAEVEFVPDLMMNLARKEILDGGSGESDAGDPAGGSRARQGGRVSPPGFSEKTDFAWVPASVLLAAMRDSRNRSTRKVVVKLGGCRYLRLFHKFVISLWGLDLAAVIKAASTPLHVRRPSMPRILLLQRDQPRGDRDAKQAGGKIGGAGKNAIRGVDCVRPSFLSGRKRTNLGIIEVRHERRAPPGRGDSSGSGGDRGAGTEGDEGAGEREPEREASACKVGGEGGRSVGGRKARSKRSGAACRKRRRQCKKARQLKAAAVAAEASSPPTVDSQGETASEGTAGQVDEGATAGHVEAPPVTEGKM
eukprot:g15423.t1